VDIWRIEKFSFDGRRYEIYSYEFGSIQAISLQSDGEGIGLINVNLEPRETLVERCRAAVTTLRDDARGLWVKHAEKTDATAALKKTLCDKPEYRELTLDDADVRIHKQQYDDRLWEAHIGCYSLGPPHEYSGCSIDQQKGETHEAFMRRVKRVRERSVAEWNRVRMFQSGEPIPKTARVEKVGKDFKR